VRSARPLAGAVAVLLVIVLVPRIADAQVPASQPPGPYVIDVRGTTLGVPQTSDFYPNIPGETVIPTRGFGVHAGAHVYPLPVRSWRIGFGVEVFLARATSTTPVIASANDDGTTTVVDIFPEIDVTQRIITPQVSLNFGTSRGWSYLSAGAGSGRVRTTADSDTLTRSKLAVNAGGGARWFVSTHFGVGFDLRANWIGSRALFAASAGFSLK
jgi:hypothetical protein